MTDLNLTSNPRAEWCFQRLKDRLAWKPGPDSLTLKIVQNALIYHAVLGVKRSGVEMSTAARQREAANTYRNFVSRHALAWLAEEGGITVPAWLTADMLGKTTLSGEPLYFWIPKAIVVDTARLNIRQRGNEAHAAGKTRSACGVRHRRQGEHAAVRRQEEHAAVAATAVCSSYSSVGSI